MDDRERTANKLERIRCYLQQKFAGKNISQAKQCALIGGEISFGYLITIEDAEGSHSVLPVNAFLEGTAVNKISQLLEERHLAGTLKKAGRKVVRLRPEGFDIWEPFESRRIA